ncbi:MAG: outer membrane lipid asymmetry maintenance protein MlaD [Rickettsiaceae bacterium]|nr:outer membrane lipid asymmetry maintenance protein MlaD [Rickettsiaceae bacterium]
MKQGVIETLVGLLVLVVAFGFLVFAYNVSNVSKTRDGYSVVANFQDIDGISEGADVKLAGIKIGYVDSVLLDSDTYYAGVRLYIDKKIEIPEDSRAVVATSGLLGGKYIRISPGGSEDNLSNEGKIKFTQSSLNIEDLIGKLMYSLTSK